MTVLLRQESEPIKSHSTMDVLERLEMLRTKLEAEVEHQEKLMERLNKGEHIERETLKASTEKVLEF